MRILQLSVAAAVLAFGWQLASGGGLVIALFAAFNSGAAAFLAWALAREFDPDREWTGLLAGALGGLTAALWGPVGLLAPALFLGLSRVVSGIVGVRANLLSLVAVWFGGFMLMVLIDNVALGIALGLAYASYASLTTSLEEGISGTVLALISAAATGFYLGLNGSNPIKPPDFELGLAGVISLLVLIRLLLLKSVSSTTDNNDLEIDIRRLRAAILIALIAAMLSLLQVHVGLAGMAPLWAALFSISI